MDLQVFLIYLHILLLVLTFALSEPQNNSSGRRRANQVKRPRTTTPTPYTGRYNSSTEIFAYLLNKNYVREVPPAESSGLPTEVKLGIYVNSIYSINEQTMDYQINFYLRQQWRDHRLSYEDLDTNIKKFRIGIDYTSDKEKIWIPDTYFRNEKRAEFHRVTVKNRLFRLSRDGTVWYVAKISATFSCPMKLQTYPMDVQVCPMSFESFGYTMDTVYFAWLESPIEIDPSVELNEFDRVDELLYDCSLNYTGGAFPCQEIQFRLRRTLGYFVIAIFIPSSLTVILSWVSFWIDIHGVPARVSIGLLTVLTTTIQSSNLNQSLPRVSYIKAIDIWMIMCLMFNFAALLEYALVNVAWRNGVKIKTPVVRQATLRTIDLDCRAAQREFRQNSHKFGCWKAENGPQLYTITVDVEGCKRRARHIDKISRKFFPLSFLLFNLVYWIAYTVIPAGFSDDS